MSPGVLFKFNDCCLSFVSFFSFLSLFRLFVRWLVFGCLVVIYLRVSLLHCTLQTYAFTRSFVRSFARSLSQAANFDLFKFLCLQLSYAVNKFLFYVFFLPSLHSMAVLFCLHVCSSYFVFISPNSLKVCLLIENFDYCFRIFDSIPFHIDFIRILEIFDERQWYSNTTNDCKRERRRS